MSESKNAELITDILECEEAMLVVLDLLDRLMNKADTTQFEHEVDNAMWQIGNAQAFVRAAKIRVVKKGIADNLQAIKESLT